MFSSWDPYLIAVTKIKLKSEKYHHPSGFRKQEWKKFLLWLIQPPNWYLRISRSYSSLAPSSISTFLIAIKSSSSYSSSFPVWSPSRSKNASWSFSENYSIQLSRSLLCLKVNSLYLPLLFWRVIMTSSIYYFQWRTSMSLHADSFALYVGFWQRACVHAVWAILAQSERH